MPRRLLPTLIFTCLCVGCPERHSSEPPRAQAAAVAVTADDMIDDDDPGLGDPAMREAPAAPLDVDHMSDEELETACFEGRQAACDSLGH